MTILYTFTNYLIKITQILDHIAAIGDKVVDVELVIMALNGSLVSWEPFVKGVCTRENFLSLRGFWMSKSRILGWIQG